LLTFIFSNPDFSMGYTRFKQKNPPPPSGRAPYLPSWIYNSHMIPRSRICSDEGESYIINLFFPQSINARHPRRNPRTLLVPPVDAEAPNLYILHCVFVRQFQLVDCVEQTRFDLQGYPRAFELGHDAPRLPGPWLCGLSQIAREPPTA
jgi:hypothetical protein